MSVRAAIQTHIERHRGRSVLGFVACVGFEIAVVAFVVRALLAPVVDDPETLIRPSISLSMLLVTGLIAPFCETLLLQGIPIELTRLFKGTPTSAFIMSAASFFACHLLGGLGAGLSAGLIGGSYLSFAYLHWRRRSQTAAVAVTFGTHAVANAIIAAALACLGGLSHG